MSSNDSIDHIVEVSLDATEQHEEHVLNEQRASTQQAPAITPSSTFFDENYTYADRDRELGLLENLLSTQLQNVRMERVLIHHTLNQSQK